VVVVVCEYGGKGEPEGNTGEWRYSDALIFENIYPFFKPLLILLVFFFFFVVLGFQTQGFMLAYSTT
jgi:hypothetical protein